MIIVVLALIVILILLCWKRKTVQSTIDNREYPVLEFPDKQQAADKLAHINKMNLRLINYLLYKYPEFETKGNIIANRLKQRYKPDRLEENDPIDKYNTSFTENKGEKTAFCLREKNSGKNQLHDDNILEFVNLHEMSHIASQGYGHDDEFWNNFKFILLEANEANLHNPQDYSNEIINYCGLDVAFNPFYDLP